jgi:hypothetical protein
MWVMTWWGRYPWACAYGYMSDMIGYVIRGGEEANWNEQLEVIWVREGWPENEDEE